MVSFTPFGLINTSLIVDVVCAVELSPVTAASGVATHENVVPEIFEVKGKLTEDPLQMDRLLTLVTVGTGCKVTVTVCGGPEQPLKEGVTV